MKPLLAVGLLILAFAAVFLLFVMSLAPWGVIDFGPPSGNFTGTTTFTTSYGYVCVASHVPGVENYAASSTITVPGIGIHCSPELYGALQVPVGPEVFVVWLVALAAASCALAFYLHRKARQSSGNNLDEGPQSRFLSWRRLSGRST